MLANSYNQHVFCGRDARWTARCNVQTLFSHTQSSYNYNYCVYEYFSARPQKRRSNQYHFVSVMRDILSPSLKLCNRNSLPRNRRTNIFRWCIITTNNDVNRYLNTIMLYGAYQIMGSSKATAAVIGRLRLDRFSFTHFLLCFIGHGHCIFHMGQWYARTNWKCTSNVWTACDSTHGAALSCVWWERNTNRRNRHSQMPALDVHFSILCLLLSSGCLFSLAQLYALKECVESQRHALWMFFSIANTMKITQKKDGAWKISFPNMSSGSCYIFIFHTRLFASSAWPQTTTSLNMCSNYSVDLWTTMLQINT